MNNAKEIIIFSLIVSAIVFLLAFFGKLIGNYFREREEREQIIRVNNSDKAWCEHLGDNYQLRRFNVKEKTEQGIISTSSAWFFLIAGSYNSKTESKTEVKTKGRLYFKNCHGRYEFLERELSVFDVEINDKANIPYISFVKNECIVSSYESCLANIKKIIVHCKEKDFPEEINIESMR